jgi:hypothetical protein
MAGEWAEMTPKPELLTLLHKFRPWKATNAGDKVFALLGLSRDGKSSPLLEANTQLPAEVVFLRVAQYMMTRYQSLSILAHAMQLPDSSGPTAVAQAAGLVSWAANWLFGNALKQVPSPTLPSWCPDWRLPYALPSVPGGDLVNPKGRVAIQGFDSRYEETTRILRVTGHAFAMISSVTGGSFDIDLSGLTQRHISNYGATCDAIAQHLHALAPLIAKLPAKGLQKADQLCILEGCTGIAILRPEHEQFKLVFLEHSDFTIVRLNAALSNRPETYHGTKEASIFLSIASSVVHAAQSGTRLATLEII